MTSSPKLELTALDQAIHGEGHAPHPYSPAWLIQINDKILEYGE